MAKTYLNTIKYLVKLKFSVEGIVDKEDIIGAVFGQSEGLLGEDMDLKELQKSGKIGRIEVFPIMEKGVTSGELNLPSSLDAAQTALLAAAIESVDKVGPCGARFEILSMEDIREEKRDKIKDRAKGLLNKFLDKTESHATLMAEELRESARTLKLVDYGSEKLPAGPDIDSSKEIIVVEGRADVLNLIKASFTNAIGMNGSTIPKTILELAKTKTITLFIDGDRGGELNARKLMSLAKIDFIAKAPDGKEVEELSRKEITQALGKKFNASDFVERNARNSFSAESNGFGSERGEPRGRNLRIGMRSHSERTGISEGYGGAKESRFPSRGRERGFGGRSTGRDRPREDSGMRRGRDERGGSGRGFGGRERGDSMRTPREGMPSFSRSFEPRVFEAMPSMEEIQKFKPAMDSLKGTLKAKFFDKEMKELGEINVRELIDKMHEIPNANSIVFDGIITKRLAEKADAQNISYLIAAKKGKIENAKVKTLTM